MWECKNGVTVTLTFISRSNNWFYYFSVWIIYLFKLFWWVFSSPCQRQCELLPKALGHTDNKGNAKRGVSPRLKIWPGDLDLWPWKSIGFQILLRTKYVPNLVKIHWRMLILEWSQGWLSLHSLKMDILFYPEYFHFLLFCSTNTFVSSSAFFLSPHQRRCEGI
jgi:hypothetical protein